MSAYLPWSRGKSHQSESEFHGDENEVHATTGPNGLATLADLNNATVDIVFVHGLFGDRNSTWTHRKANQMWPRDLLPQDLPTARIATWGYDADVVRFGVSVAGANNLRGHGKNLATDVGTWRARTETPDQRPIIFVAHSLGGLVVKQALKISGGASGDTEHLKSILERTYGVIFMGTPHMGADLASWGNILGKMVHVVNRTNQPIAELLKPTSEVLSNLQQEFDTMITTRRFDSGRELRMYCFYEEIPIRGVGKIVEDRSAILSYTENTAIPGTHISMTKYPDRNDTGYQRVRDQLWIWVKKLQSQSTRPGNSHDRRQGHAGSNREPQNRPHLIEYHQQFNSGGGSVSNGTFNSGGGDFNIYGRGR